MNFEGQPKFSSLTPMMQQYLAIKAQYPDALLLYRIGDFYELFMDDAIVASKILNIALTSRDKNSDTAVPMCGVPHHAAEQYIAKLVSAGYKVAICEQVEDPRFAKGIVKREVTRVITPGLILEEQNLSAKLPNYICSLAHNGTLWGVAYMDVSTGEFRVVEISNFTDALEELHRIDPRELLVSESLESSIIEEIGKHFQIAIPTLPPEYFDQEAAEERLCHLFSVHSLEGFGLQGFSVAIGAAGALTRYAEDNKISLSHIKGLIPYSRSDFMNLDENTEKHLEIFYSQSFRGRKGSLIDVVDRTCTPMGGRMLHRWLRYPLLKKAHIMERQDAIDELVNHPQLLREIRSHLESVGDIERILSRIAVGSATPKDIYALKLSLKKLPDIYQLIDSLKSNLFQDIKNQWDNGEEIVSRIDSILIENPPLNWISQSIIKDGVDLQLDEYKQIAKDSKGWLLRFEQQERSKTGLSSLKVRYNKVFGYFIELSKTQASQAPPHYQRKQTLTNAERFITEEIKAFETKILEAEYRRQEIEEEYFEKLKRDISSQSDRIHRMANIVAMLDCIASLAELAITERYCRPLLTNDGSIIIKEGRHPVVEKYLPRGTFVPNDVELNMSDQQILIITGPNMAGKSTILRQTALIVLLAHIGSFVPAKAAYIGLVDRIFTRIGTSDDLARGRSTFLVEMQEVASILHRATPQSLVILDEIGRGTSTYDGMSIAQAVIEYLHDLQGAGVKTLCATHYHELTELSEKFPRVKNFSVAVREWQDRIIFTHRLVPERASKSYGIYVAKLAGLPEQIIERAKIILRELEARQDVMAVENPTRGQSAVNNISYNEVPRRMLPKKVGFQLPILGPAEEWLRQEILSIDLDRTTPLGALQILYAIQERLKKEKTR
ncbi:MAG: DNA mismatch repair protein MutS [Syntrophobacterales bacterium]|nr:DNA mismatch repair protein MutS [Syntrophobacterales bacterium]